MTGIRVIERASRNLSLGGDIARGDLVAATVAILAWDGRAEGDFGPLAALIHADDQEVQYGPRHPSAAAQAAIAHLAERAGLSGTEGDAYTAMGGYASNLAIRIEWPRSATARAAEASRLDAKADRVREILAESLYDGTDPFQGRG